MTQKCPFPRKPTINREFDLLPRTASRDSPQQLPENVLTELCATSGSCCQDLTEVRETDKKVRETDKKVRKTDTNNNTTINNTHTTEVGDDVDAHYLDGLVGGIAANLKVERTKIDREKLAAVR